MDTADLGVRIRSLREQRGLSLQELAVKAGISVSFLCELERGQKKPSLKTISKIAAALNLARGSLLGQPERSSLGPRLRQHRRDAGLTIDELAQRVGISTSYLSEIERDNVAPSIQVLKKIAGELGLSLPAVWGQTGFMGRNLRQTRREQGLTQAELAARCNLSPGLIGQLEQGRVQPSLPTVEKLARALGVSPCYFVADHTGIGEMLQMFPPEAQRLFAEPQVQAVLKLLCGCSEKELRFILEFIKLYKRRG